MALIVDPGPLPDDGTRINVDRELDAFINGTKVRNFGVNEFSSNEAVHFVASQTDAPATSTRTAGMLWFKRGEGTMFFWDAQNASESLAAWVACSNRKELVVRIQSGPTLEGSVVWLDAGYGQGQFTELFGIQVDVNRMVMKCCATDMAIENSFLRALPVPPYFVAPEQALTYSVTGFSGVGDGVYRSVVELGYCRAQVDGVGPGAGILQNSNPATRDDAWLVSTEPLGFSNSWGAHIVESGVAAADGTLMVFLKSTPANVGW
jgi:hypothetical protein